MIAVVLILLLNNSVLAQDLFAQAQSNYREGQFDRLFGLIRWSRGHIDFSSQEKDRWLALELMALARHCRWLDIYSRETLVKGPLAKKAMEVIRLKEEYKKFSTDPDLPHLSVEKRLASMQEHWRINDLELRKIKSPKYIRLHVESQCGH